MVSVPLAPNVSASLDPLIVSLQIPSFFDGVRADGAQRHHVVRCGERIARYSVDRVIGPVDGVRAAGA